MKKARVWLWCNNLSLATRLLLGSGLALLGCGVALLYAVLQVEIADHRATLSSRLHEEMQFALPALAGPAVVGDYSVIEQILKARVQQPIIAQFVWTDNFRSAILVSGQETRVAAPRWFVQWLALPSVEQWRYIVVGEEIYGTVSLRLTSVVSINKLWQGFLQKCVILLISAGVSFGVTLVVLHRGIRPLHALASSARRFGEGDYAVRIPLHGPSETLQCIQAFNGMAENIASLLASLRQVLNAIPIPVVITRVADGAILYENRHHRTMLGLAEEGRKDRKATEFYYNPADRQHMLKLLAEHGYVSNYELHLKKADGVPFWVVASLQTITFESEEALFVGFYDSTATRNAEEALRHMHERTVQLLDAISSILIGVDADTGITWWNHEADKTLGSIPVEVIGKPIATCQLPWDSTAIAAGLATCADTGAPVRVNDVRFQRPDGKEGYLGITINPMPGVCKDDRGFLLLGADITERKSLEQQLMQAQKLEAIGQLAAGIAHEINTPTQFIGDNIRFLQDAFGDLCTLLKQYDTVMQAQPAGGVPESLHREVEALAETIDVGYLIAEIPMAISQSIEGVERVARLVQAMKEFSHPSNGEKIAVDLNKAIDSTIIVARNEWKYVAELVTDFDPTLPLVPCFPGAFNQVILNIIVNAAHALTDVVGDGAQGKGTITVSTGWEQGWAEICIADTGAGIPAAIQEKIFDPFFTTKGVGKGTGQGLAIAHDVVVKKHGGTLTFESAEGRGTTFIIRLPLHV